MLEARGSVRLRQVQALPQLRKLALTSRVESVTEMKSARTIPADVVERMVELVATEIAAKMESHGHEARGDAIWLTVPEAADRMGCSTDHVRDLYRSGEIDAFKPGKAYLIPRRSVDDYIRSRPVRA